MTEGNSGETKSVEWYIAEREINHAKIKAQREEIKGLRGSLKRARDTIQMMRNQRAGEIANETRDIDELIRCQTRIENQRQRIKELEAGRSDG